MAKAMEKKSVIYGEAKSQPAAGWSRWAEAEAAVMEQVGQKVSVNWNPAKEALKKAVANPKMKEAYIKIGLVGTDLVFRIKEKKFLGDIEEDALLVRGYAEKAATHAEDQAALTASKDGARKQLLAELKVAKDRQTVWPLLRKLGASQAELDKLDDGQAVVDLLKKIDVDLKDIPISTNQLFNDKGRARGMLQVVSKPADMVKLLYVLGIKQEKIDSLGNGYAPTIFAKDLEAVGVDSKTALKVAETLVDVAAEAPKKPPAAPDVAGAKTKAAAIALLHKRGIPVATLQGWTEQADLDDVVEAIVAKGLPKSEAERLAGLICP